MTCADMREHEHLAIIGRGIAPPAFPAVVSPVAADGAEHVAAENPCADILETAFGHVVVDAG